MEKGIESAMLAVPAGPHAMLVAVGLGLGAEVTKEVGAPIVELLKNGDARFLDALAGDRASEISQQQEDLVANMNKLLSKVGDQAGVLSNIAVIFAEYGKARNRTADTKKARLLFAALVHAFDADIYQEGITLSLFKILADLDYGDVHVLAGLNAEGAGFKPEFRFEEFVSGSTQFVQPRSLLAWHIRRLYSHSLVAYPELQSEIEVRRLQLGIVGLRLLRLIGTDSFAADADGQIR